MAPLHRFIPRLSREQLSRMPVLGRLSGRLLHPRLWQASRTPVARAAAVGAFFAFATPVAQIPLALATALVWRIHLPTAAAATLVNNPLTFAPVYYAAYRTGDWLLSLVREPASGSDAAQLAQGLAKGLSSGGFTWSEQAAPVLGATFLGALVFGAVAACLAWGVVQGAWRLKAVSRARRLRRQGAPRGSEAD